MAVQCCGGGILVRAVLLRTGKTAPKGCAAFCFIYSARKLLTVSLQRQYDEYNRHCVHLTSCPQRVAAKWILAPPACSRLRGEHRQPIAMSRVGAFALLLFFLAKGVNADRHALSSGNAR